MNLFLFRNAAIFLNFELLIPAITVMMYVPPAVALENCVFLTEIIYLFHKFPTTNGDYLLDRHKPVVRCNGEAQHLI